MTKAHTIIALAKLFCCSFVSGTVGVKVKYENNFHPRKKYDIILENWGRKAFRHDTTSDTGDVPGSWLVIIFYNGSLHLDLGRAKIIVGLPRNLTLFRIISSESVCSTDKMSAQKGIFVTITLLSVLFGPF